MTKSRMLIFCGYGIALILLLYFGINDLISTVLSDTFPNARFIIIFTLIIIVAWFIGVGTRKYLNGFNNDDTRNKIRDSFVGITAFSWIIVLTLFWIT